MYAICSILASLCAHVIKVSMSSLFLISTDVLPPGPIDNTPLLEVGGADHTHKLVDSASYRKLSHSTWSYFRETYGGRPCHCNLIIRPQ